MFPVRVGKYIWIDKNIVTEAGISTTTAVQSKGVFERHYEVCKYVYILGRP